MSFPKHSITTLSNNIKILWIPVKNSKSVGVSVTIDAGFFEEKNNQIGLAHFLEHMIARNLKDGPIMKKLRDKGIIVESNAQTSNFRTMYHAHADSTHYIDIIKLVLRAYNHRVIDKNLFESEKNAVIVEMKKKMIDAENIANYKELPVMMFGSKTKMKIDPMEHIKIVKQSTPQDLIDYMTSNYQAGRTVITVSGNYNKTQSLKLLKKELEKIPKSQKLPMRVIKGVTTGLFPKIKYVADKKRKVTKLSLIFKCFDSSHEEKKYAVKLMSNILFRIGDKSILFNRLRTRLGVAYSPYAINSFYPQFGVFAFKVDVEPKNIEITLKELSLIIKELRSQLVPTNLIKLAKSRAKFDIKESLYNINPTRYFSYSNKVLDEEPIVNPETLYQEFYSKYNAGHIKKIAKEVFKKNKCYLTLVGNNSLSNTKLRNLLDF